MSPLKKSLLLGLVMSLPFGLQAKDKKEGEKKAPPTPESILEKLDTDKDTKISLEEYLVSGKTDVIKKKLETKFKGLDKDQDGFLTIEELKVPSKKGSDKHKEEKPQDE
jgi:Ca2+-binding EF-hand superfamily protein